jgi:HNH endonuclease
LQRRRVVLVSSFIPRRERKVRDFDPDAADDLRDEDLFEQTTLKQTMKILCKCGKEVVLDPVDHEKLKNIYWSCTKQGSVYHFSGGNSKAITWFIYYQPIKGMVWDHINGDKHDNRKINLRLVSHQQNCLNQGPRKGRKYKGVFFEKKSKTNPYFVEIMANGVKKRLGCFPTEEAAARAYNKASMELHGPLGYINPID